jgi:membrane protein DedA with SNARE-associated domain
MGEIIFKIVSVYISCMLKFILGPVGGYAAGFNIITTILITIAGMMTVVFLFVFFGTWIKKYILEKIRKPSNKFTVNNRKFVNLWKRYGLAGVAALTPLVLTPIGGTILALSSGSPRNKIISYMFISAVVWATVFSLIIYFFGNEVIPEFLRPSPVKFPL